MRAKIMTDLITYSNEKEHSHFSGGSTIMPWIIFFFFLISGLNFLPPYLQYLFSCKIYSLIALRKKKRKERMEKAVLLLEEGAEVLFFFFVHNLQHLSVQLIMTCDVTWKQGFKHAADGCWEYRLGRESWTKLHRFFLVIYIMQQKMTFPFLLNAKKKVHAFATETKTLCLFSPISCQANLQAKNESCAAATMDSIRRPSTAKCKCLRTIGSWKTDSASLWLNLGQLYNTLLYSLQIWM